MKAGKYWILLLLILPCLFGWLAYTGHGFFYKAAVAGTGIVYLLYFYRKKLRVPCREWCIIAAFLFSIIGDWFLSTRHGSSQKFVLGIAFFLLAHGGYIGFSLWHGRLKWIFTLVLLGSYLVFFFSSLSPSLQDPALRIAVLVYLIVSCISLGAAAGTNLMAIPKWVYVFGITMIVFSDTIIALREFTSYRELGFLILPTYYIAQISVTMALLLNKINPVKS